MKLKTFEGLLGLFETCEPLNAKSLRDYIGNLMDMDLSALSQAPGTPAQVLTNQFVVMVRTSCRLKEEMMAESSRFNRLSAVIDAEVTRRERKRTRRGAAA